MSEVADQHPNRLHDVTQDRNKLLLANSRPFLKFAIRFEKFEANWYTSGRL